MAAGSGVDLRLTLFVFALQSSRCDDSLARRSTSEGKFLCGRGSAPYMLIARSNVQDTFPGGEYADSFDEIIGRLLSFFSHPPEQREDGSILDCLLELRLLLAP